MDTQADKKTNKVTSNEQIRYLQNWREVALREFETARETLIDAQRRFTEAEQRVKSIENLLFLEGENMPDSRSLLSKDAFIDAAVTVLEVAGHPMRISEIREQLLEEGVPLPGKGNDANLIATFQRSGGRIIRVARGAYDIPREREGLELLFPDGKTAFLSQENTIGRSDRNDIILNDRQVAPAHARIEILPEGILQLVVLTTKSPSKLNGITVTAGKHTLHNEDEVTLGQTSFVIRSA